MVTVDASKGARGQSDRAKTSKSVRLDDRQGFDHKFNKTGFKCEAKRHLYYYYVKCYEQVLRGKDAKSVLTRREFLKYRRLAESNRLKPLPEEFPSFKEPEKIETLSKLIEEQVDAGVGIVQQCEDVGIQVIRPGKMEVDEGSSADLGPEYSINKSSTLDGDSLQGVARDFQDNPQGRPPTGLGHPENFQQCMSELKRWAYSYPDLLMEVEKWEQQGMQLISKLNDRDICESLGVGSSNTLIRSRQEEIFSQLQGDIMAKDPPNQCRKPSTEGADLQASYSQASNFGMDVKHVKQDPAIDPLSTASSLIVRPDHCISELLKVTPSYTGRLKVNLEEIHPRVAGDLLYQFSNPMTEVSHPQPSDLWGHKQYGGEYLTTMPHSGGNSASQVVPMGHSVSADPLVLERPTPELWAEKPWNEPALEGSQSPLWTHHWQSPVRF